MSFSKRTKLSLAQLLNLQNYQTINLLLEKYSLPSTCMNINDLKDILTNVNHDIFPIIHEVIATPKSLKDNVISKISFNERFDDLKKCLLLDGYKIEKNHLIRIEPIIDGIRPVEDDLISIIELTSLYQKKDIIKFINESADAFKQSPPDYNGCLSKIRLSLETIVRNIANEVDGNNDKWGTSLNKLVKNNFFEKKEEESIAATYTFISDGSHLPLGFTDEEYARFGRNLILSVCYYIIKKYHNQDKNIFSFL